MWVEAACLPSASKLRSMQPVAMVGLFVVTAIAEIAGCYLVYLWTRGDRSSLLLVAAGLCLAAFAWLLSFHPSAGRAYAAYGGVYVACAVGWGWLIEHRTPDRWDLIGAAVSLIGMSIIALAPRS